MPRSPTPPRARAARKRRGSKSAPGKDTSANHGGARVVSAAATTTTRGRGRRVDVEIADLRWGKVIGRGSHGVVRLARHVSSGKRFVVKLIPLEEKDAERDDGDARCSIPGTMTEREAREVEAEARTLRLASSHPNVCTYHGCARRVDERTGGRELLIIMSHCEGGDLASLMRSVNARGEALPEEVVMRWVVQLLLALQHVHALGIIHRDVKPANVFLSRNLKVVKLGDFGVAKRLSHVNDLANTVVGTPLYMSPELCAGKPYTYAADVWALGCVVLELALGGKKAFESRGYGELLVKISRNDYAPVPSRYSRPFAALVGSMLAPDPRERPAAEALLNTAIARRHCDALLAEVAGGGGVGGVGAGAGTTLGLGLGLGLGGAARSSRTPSRAMGREAPSAAAVLAAEEASRSIARVQSLLLGGGGGDGVGGSTDRGGAADRGAGASPAAAAEAEKQRIAEKRHDARQRASRRARNAVREADPRRIAAQIKAEEENLRRVEAQERRAVAAAEEELLRRAGSFGLGEDDDDDADAVAVAGMGEDGVERRGVVAFASRPRLERTIAAPSPNVPRDRDAAAAAATEPEPYPEPEPDAETALMAALLAEARIDLESEITSRDRESTPAVDIATVDIPVSLATIDVPAPEDAARFAATFAATSNRVGTAPAGGGRCRRGSGHVAGVPIVSASWDCERARADRQHARDAALERHVRAKLRSFLRRSDDVAAENAAADVASDVASGSDVASDNFRQFPLSGSFTYLSAAALGEEDGDEETEEADDVVASPRPATAGAMLGGGGRRREDGDAAALERDEEDEDEEDEEEDEEEEYAYSDFEEDFGSCLGDSDDDDDDGGE